MREKHYKHETIHVNVLAKQVMMTTKKMTTTRVIHHHKQ